jgi:hypothetical protein
MGRFTELFTSRRKSPKLEPRPEPPAPTVAERAKDQQAQLDEDYRAMVAAANEAFLAELLRNGYHWPGDPSPSLEAHRERLREARGGRRW